MDTNFGCDPEVFVVDKETGVVLPPAAMLADYGIMFEALDTPKKIIISSGDWKVIEDGAATELNVMPTPDVGVLMNRINSAIRELTRFVGVNLPNHKVEIKASVPFDPKKYWENRDESFRDCVRFGCDPDLDIYTGKYSVEVDSSKIKNRFGGGHIHMQAPLDNPDLFEDTYFHAARLMDIMVGCAGTAIRRNSLSDNVEEKERLVFYGRPGKIRLQNYSKKVKGIEYRPPSNFWLKDRSHANILFTMMNCVYNLVQNPEDASVILNGGFTETVPLTILNYNKRRANYVITEVLNHLLEMKYIETYFFVECLQNIVGPDGE